MATQKWIAGASAAVTVISAGLNSLANGSAANSATLDNTTDLNLYADLELYIASHGTAPTADTTYDLYLVRSIDGTNLEDASASRPPANGAVGSFVMDNVTTAQRKVIPGVLIPPGKYQWMIVNKCGQAPASTLNTLKMTTYNQQVI